MIRITVFTLCVFGLLISCGPGPDPVEFQTDILGINIEPSPGIVGEEMTFTCIIEDSLNIEFEFAWVFSNIDSTLVTKEKKLVVNFDNPGEFSATVRGYIPDDIRAVPTASFSFSIVNPIKN